jgi:asparagine synthase (glutamine-hydrolysing)
MCGISGFSWEDTGLIDKMVRSLAYRGPDDSGIFVDNVSLGHNRLSIIDLSSAGHQPMCNEEGDIWIVFNGEIYNHAEIRPILEKKGHKFKSETDTETIIHSYEEWGVDCLSRFNGMFAFAIWDSKKKTLFLARDRLGVKPLYYHHGKNLIFSSEIKAILEHGISREIDRDAINSFLTYRFIPGDRTILKGIRKLLPGHYLICKDNQVKTVRYWQLDWSEKPGKYEEQLENLLLDSVEKRLMSDVPLGAFLSGGIDSSLIVAMNAKLRGDKVKTFTVGFGHASDEFKHARAAAEHIGTDHHELTLDYRQMTKALPDIVWHMDEPNSDITMVPLYFLSRFAKKKVTVVNTGEGADELFSGYQHFKIGGGPFQLVPEAIRKPVYRWYYSPFKASERAELMQKKPAEDKALAGYLDRKEPKHLLNRILLFDIENELPNWQLTRVDRMTMAHGMEARVPFLDYRIVELSAKMPAGMKMNSLEGKHVLRKVAAKYLPKSIIMRKKQGFTTPRGSWLKADMHDAAARLLTRENVMRRGIFNADYVDTLLSRTKGKEDLPMRPHSYKLLILSLLEIWMRQYIDQETVVL